MSGFFRQDNYNLNTIHTHKHSIALKRKNNNYPRPYVIGSYKMWYWNKIRKHLPVGDGLLWSHAPHSYYRHMWHMLEFSAKTDRQLAEIKEQGFYYCLKLSAFCFCSAWRLCSYCIETRTGLKWLICCFSERITCDVRWFARSRWMLL